jgi:NAD(P)-dependent dehydrogenase (short-subunit alcohol dehydrogenase family)
VDTLTRGLGLQVADQGIRVVGVVPGLIDTDLHARTGDPDRIARMAPDIPSAAPVVRPKSPRRLPG